MFEELINDARQTPATKKIIQLLLQWVKNGKYDDLFFARIKYQKLTREKQKVVALKMAEEGWLGEHAGEVIELFDCSVTF